ncbi:hypothetical protein V8E53_013976 [Lactarius tabidus]
MYYSLTPNRPNLNQLAEMMNFEKTSQELSDTQDDILVKKRSSFAPEDFMFGLGPKPVVSKYLLSQQHHRETQAFLYARVYGPKTQEDRVAVSLCRIYLWCKDAFPTSRLKDEWAVDVWREACENTRANRDAFIQPPELFLDSGMKLFLETKRRIGDAVEVYYAFDTRRSGVSRNANLAKALLRDKSFVYLVCPSSLLLITY